MLKNLFVIKEYNGFIQKRMKRNRTSGGIRRIRTSGDATKENEFAILLMSVDSFILPTLNQSLFGFLSLLSACLEKMALQMKFLDEMNKLK